MWNKDSSENWYALFVSTGNEEKVKQAIDRTFGDEIKSIVPKREGFVN